MSRTAWLAGVAIVVGAGAARRSAGSGLADQERVTEKLTAAGYTAITGLEADNGHWEGKGVRNGKIMEFHVDPHSGRLTKEEVDR